ncbi:hypothetical protein [Rhizobium leucaenae]|uniref:hypothetical protein n=1 Tax=Rhizobium leucaenae TaxID=29450 RepID=UPI00160C8C80|nr:hypothetical protein [Rhizobium leucaenae]MBB6299929.1 hypothetical protein [Rhizobium leucaenae]
MDLKLVNVPASEWQHALHIAGQFRGKYGPDEHTGVRRGVAFVDLMGRDPNFYVYYTKTAIVVRKGLELAQ